MIDFIIVGRGLAANVLAHNFHKNNISFNLIGNDKLSNCSNAAAGIWNPVVFKRLTKSWLAQDLISCLNKFYTECELRVNSKFLTQRVIIKPFTEDQEKKLWVKKAESELIDFLDDRIYNLDLPELSNCKISNQYGVVKQSGNLDLSEFCKSSSLFFQQNILDEFFDHKKLTFNNTSVTYHNVIAKNIIFCEGYLVKSNPYFNWIPLKPAKGETLIISAPDLKFKNKIVNKNGFLIDLKNGVFKLGATYNWDHLSDECTDQGLQELKSKLNSLINCDYSIISHLAGVRPSSIDRRPIIGAHPEYKNLFVFNGLGTKGVMLAPYFSENFVNFYLKNEPLIDDVNVKRFYSNYAG